jgi:hypothetical protein
MHPAAAETKPGGGPPAALLRRPLPM